MILSSILTNLPSDFPLVKASVFEISVSFVLLFLRSQISLQSGLEHCKGKTGHKIRVPVDRVDDPTKVDCTKTFLAHSTLDTVVWLLEYLVIVCLILKPTTNAQNLSDVKNNIHDYFRFFFHPPWLRNGERRLDSGYQLLSMFVKISALIFIWKPTSSSPMFFHTI